MTRPIVLSNGSLHVGINYYGMVHDFYYPYVGLENHAIANNMRWRIGVWVEGRFSWLDDGDWQFSYGYEADALVGHTLASHQGLGVSIDFNGCVDMDYDVFLRSIKVTNQATLKREIRLFVHQVMRISNSLNGDTAQFLPNEVALLHYKGNRVFVFGGTDEQGVPFTQYSVGVYGIEGKDGTYRDAEDGILSGNAVEHGSVDSVMGFSLHLDPTASSTVSYWVVASTELHDALRVFGRIKTDGLAKRIAKTADSWRQWLRPANTYIENIDPQWHTKFKNSLLIIKSHLDKRGALIASTDTTMRNYSRDAYAYCWPRDAALSLWPLLRLGYFQEVRSFFRFCRETLQAEGFLMHKYQADGAVGSSWHPYLSHRRVVPPIQEDETAIVIFLFGQYYQATEDKELLHEFYDSFIRPAANFMAGFIDEATKLPHATYDIWEEKLLTTTYTTAVVYAALVAAAQLAEAMDRQHESVEWQTVADDMRTAAHHTLFDKERNFFLKGFIRRRNDDGSVDTIYDKTIDTSSFYGAFMFGLFDLDSEPVQRSFRTLQQTFGLENAKVTPVPRYENDPYRRTSPDAPSNPWFVTTLWLAQYYMELGQHDKAKAIINFVGEHMLATGVLSEQMDPKTYQPVSVAPLCWSQAEFLNSIIDLHSDPLKLQPKPAHETSSHKSA